MVIRVFILTYNYHELTMNYHRINVDGRCSCVLTVASATLRDVERQAAGEEVTT